ncbi:MAG: class I SAM-dependent methyltransferase [Ilumatobacteraceae bacterium]
MASTPDDQSAPANPIVVEANQRVHSQLAGQYNETEPHFRPENQAKVRRRLEELAEAAPSRARMLDLGCGTGFLLNLSHDLFDSIDGVDATQAMLDRVDLSPGNITLHLGVVEHLPFADGTFDVVTAYSFLDHLADHVPVLHEANRVLKPGGKLYVDLIPNREFWNSIYAAADSDQRPLDAIVEREINELVNHEQKLQDQFGIDPIDWQNAEPAKSGGKGFDANELRAQTTGAGFDANIRFEWFLGQAVVMHGISMEASQLVDDHLRRLLPTSANLYKYLVLTGTKR